MGDEEFLLKWHDHHASFFLLVEELVTREQLTDVTLSCGDMILNAHSLMLSVCSPYFRSLLSENQHREKHHIIHLNGVPGRLMQQLLVYMYRGEISICQEDLGPLIETARCLQIKGLSMANSDVTTSNMVAKKRPSSQAAELPLSLLKSKERKFAKKPSPVKSLSPPLPVEGKQLALNNDIIKDEEDYNQSIVDYPEYNTSTSKEITEIQVKEFETAVKELDANGGLKDYGLDYKHKMGSQTGVVALPMLPKPLSILKTAETRTYLSKLIWLGNGGKRPQYGNPDTKPLWWPQHVLPWEEMKKMGGRKSQELSHINYTEILKQCLAAGYEYFGYDPSSYYATEAVDLSSYSDTSYDEYNGTGGGGDGGGSLAITHSMEVDESPGSDPNDSSSDLREPEPALEIDLDEPPEPAAGGGGGCPNTPVNQPSLKDQILCK